MSDVECEVDTDELDHEGTWLAEGELYLFAKPLEIAGHEVFAAAMVGGDAYLGLTSTGKMHRLEIEKGLPAKQADAPKLRAIKT